MKLRLFVAAMAAFALSACDSSPSGIPQSCTDIIEACHEVDPGTGEEHDCHETAHDVGTAEACDPIATRCVMLCEALTPVDGGGHDHDGGDADGGDHDHDAAP